MKITPALIADMRKFRVAGATLKEVGDKFGVAPSTAYTYTKTHYRPHDARSAAPLGCKYSSGNVYIRIGADTLAELAHGFAVRDRDAFAEEVAKAIQKDRLSDFRQPLRNTVALLAPSSPHCK